MFLCYRNIEIMQTTNGKYKAIHYRNGNTFPLCENISTREIAMTIAKETIDKVNEMLRRI